MKIKRDQKGMLGKTHLSLLPQNSCLELKGGIEFLAVLRMWSLDV